MDDMVRVMAFVLSGCFAVLAAMLLTISQNTYYTVDGVVDTTPTVMTGNGTSGTAAFNVTVDNYPEELTDTVDASLMSVQCASAKCRKYKVGDEVTLSCMPKTLGYGRGYVAHCVAR